MNRLNLTRRTQIINCLVEGNSIRSVERMTDTHRDTAMRLLVEVGTGCAKLMDEQMRNLACERIQVDEIWSYVQKKQRQMTRRDDPRRVGDQWTFVALDPQTKLVPTYLVGKRTKACATKFIADLSDRLSNRVQLSSDALNSYVDAVEKAFGANVDYGQSVKFYEAEPIGPGRYSPPRVTKDERTAIMGDPDPAYLDREHESCGVAAFRPLQLRATASLDPGNASNGGRSDEPPLDDSRINRGRTKTQGATFRRPLGYQ